MSSRQLPVGILERERVVRSNGLHTSVVGGSGSAQEPVVGPPPGAELLGATALIADAPVGMGFLDAGLRFVEANGQLARAYGASELVGRSLAALCGSRDHTPALVEQVWRTGRPASIDTLGAAISYHRVSGPHGVPLGIGVVAVANAPLGRLEQLELRAETDGLTGLLNHRAFQERLHVEFNRARRHDRPLALAMVDVDSFKQLNDSYGHQAGDEALRGLAARLSAVGRATDTVARLGGDELALLLPETTAEQAHTLMDRAQAALRKEARTAAGAGFTVSIGLCDMPFANHADDLLRFADGALYRAKANGRDQICLYDPELVQDLSLEQRSERLLRGKALAGIRSLARAIDAKDHSTLLHSERVASLAARLAEELGWPSDRVTALRETALIHDVGKIGVPVEVLLKTGALTSTEYALVKTHALLGAVIAGEVLDDEQITWLRSNHERFDGAGYPDGLRGAEIPEGARILSVSDSWDVMTSKRGYSRAMTATEAIAECQHCAGGQFDPAIIAVLTRPGFERILRFFANEQATRDRNEAHVAGDRASVFHLHCECGAEDCRSTIDVAAEDYRAVRKIERRYLVARGHEIDEIEDTVAVTEDYAIVEKT